MLPYGVIYLLMAINAFFNSNRTKHFSLLFLLIFLLFFSFRNNVGTDWDDYEYYFNNILDIYTVERFDFEYGYWLFNFLGSYLFDSYRYIVILIGFFIGFLFWQGANKYSKSIGVLTLLSLFYLFYPSIEAIRQSVTLFLFFYSLQYIEKNKKRYLLLNFIGLLFHRTGVFPFLFLFFNNNKGFKIPIIASLLLFATIEPFVYQIVSYFPSFADKYYWYFHYVEVEQTLFSFKTLEYMILLISFLILSKKSVLTAYENIAKNLLLIGFILQISLGQLTDIVYRMTYYTDIGVIFAYTFIYERIKIPTFKLIYILVLTLYVFLRFFRVFPFDDPSFIYSILD
jgi:EpsG family